MNPDRPFAWLSLDPRRDVPPRPVPQQPKTVKPTPDPAAVTLKRLRKENKDLRRRVRVLERSRVALIRRAAEKGDVDVSICAATSLGFRADRSFAGISDSRFQYHPTNRRIPQR